MKLALLLVLILALMVLISIPVSHADSRSLVIINFTYQVDPGAQDYFHSVLSYAVSHNDPVIIVMNTPGGYLTNGFAIVNYTIAAEKSISVTTYVPSGNMAASAGSYIALSSDYVYMGNASFIGPSTPYIIGGTSLEQQHVTNASLAFMESLAEVHGWNQSAVKEMVEHNVAYTSQNASKIGLITGVADNLSAVVQKLGYQGLPQIQFYENTVQQLESFLSNSTVADFLILIGAVAILLDIFHGSIALSVAGIVALALGFWGVTLISFQPIAVLFMVMGIALIFLEIKLGHGLAMVGGVVLVIAGGLILMVGVSYSSNIPVLGETSYALIALEATVLPIGALYLIGIRKAAMGSPSKVGPQNIVGKKGKAVTDIDPQTKGVINVKSEEWTATSSEAIMKGDQVEVIAYSEGVATVKKSS
ncbi:MAG: ATP-dependent Clp protease proteolytic subunit [Thermoplasmatales archaeon]|nr:ATP-dependent Clp protease proteolytic subunit [Candidatus Thermoplasmatota archaeon]MCL6002826.1 ATP-dependent Clp protease proteolytic subunit [Candidatus Thermoplasmatota archaeon]MDA8054312.1 ATP-dependent Clp protease proteolytic subunit [Thermoplasmatales archaeon]